MKTETISFLKQNAANLQLAEPMVITQNGRPSYVIESYESRQRRDQAIALLKLLSFGEKSRDKGETKSVEEVMGNLKRKYANKENLHDQNLRGNP
jgi:hypothetical protein